MELRTPAYVVHEDLLRRNLSLIKDVEKLSRVKVIISLKAFALWKLFPILREYGFGAAASGAYEARLASEGLGQLAHTYSPAFTEKDFPMVMLCSQCVTFNSLSQLARFMPMLQNGGYNVSAGLRVNPEYSEIKTELYNPCAPGSRFGVLAEQLKDGWPEGVDGMHVHQHCESGADELERSLAHVEEKFGKFFPQLKWLNLGGGHLMTREGYDLELLVRLLRGLKLKYPWLRIILEPGSAFAWHTGELVASVVDIVENHGIRTAILDVSFTCHMPDCLEMPYQPEVRGAESLSPDFCRQHPEVEHVYRLGGNSCLSGDYMGCWRFDHDLQVGEQVVLEDMIHYTTVKTTMFNGVPHPSIVWQHANGRMETLKQYSFDDYKQRMC